jgi:threonine dehydrogenase-like Zn-dependent dehydrogenase
MRAVTVVPGRAESLTLADVPDPQPGPEQALLETLAVGICGTDRELLAGEHGAPVPGAAVLIPGHECLAQVVSAPVGSGLQPGELVAPTVRRPCGDPRCYPCAHDHPDMCTTLKYTERGIQGADGYQCERFVESPRYLVPVPATLRRSGVLVEPTSVVAKAVEESVRIQRGRLIWDPRRALVTGAGPVGLLAAMLLRLRRVEVTVYDRLPPDSGKARAATALGARYLAASQTPLDRLAADGGYDWILECTGAPSVVFGVMPALAPCGVMCLLGVSGGGAHLDIAAADLNLGMVIRNNLVFGSVNASREAFTQAVQALAAAESTWPGWADGLITRRVPPADMRAALQNGPEDVKVVVAWHEG